jgi:hypothetical protein
LLQTRSTLRDERAERQNLSIHMNDAGLDSRGSIFIKPLARIPSPYSLRRTQCGRATLIRLSRAQRALFLASACTEALLSDVAGEELAAYLACWRRRRRSAVFSDAALERFPGSYRTLLLGSTLCQAVLLDFASQQPASRHARERRRAAALHDTALKRFPRAQRALFLASPLGETLVPDFAGQELAAVETGWSRDCDRRPTDRA